jgi:diguanylate cyclase (GGDEF)-like protein
MVDITDQKRFEWQLKHHATHDPLTGLTNRTLFSDRLHEAIGRTRSNADYRYTVLFLDLDGFKVINDSLGHAMGDQLLVEIARRLQDCVGSRGLLARYGGDEFTILAEQVDEVEEARALAEEVLAQFKECFRIGRHELFSSASAGIVLGGPDYHSPDLVLRDADTAMYQAKAQGKGKAVLFDDSMHTAAKDRLALETELRLALERNEFTVHYQPVVSLQDGHIAGLEALVRWQHPESGLLFPDEFLRVAEETGLILPLDWWVLETACRQLVAWQASDPSLADLTLHVNVDDRQFQQDGLSEHLKKILEDTRINPDCLQLEITESVFRENVSDISDKLERLEELGVTLHVDDFGTGYSSLDSFTALEFHGMKIDRSFVHDLETNPRHRAIVRTILRFAADLNMVSVAEGIESSAQARILTQLGCTLGQGFLYSPAVSAEEIGVMLDRGTAAMEG